MAGGGSTKRQIAEDYSFWPDLGRSERFDKAALTIAAVKATLYVIPGSHPSVAARLMLEHKGIEYRRVDLVAAIHKPVLRALGFPGATVPALKLDGRRIQGSRTISRALDELRPDPPLFPAEPEARQRVEEAERWGDEVLQPVPRRLGWWALRRDRSTIDTFLEGARLGIPTALAARTSAPIIRLAARLNESSDESARADLAALPAMLDKVDAWIEDGVVNAPELNAADFQIATSVRLLMCFDDLRPVIEPRRAGALAQRVVPSFPGRIPPVVPRGWLQSAASAVRVAPSR